MNHIMAILIDIPHKILIPFPKTPQKHLHPKKYHFPSYIINLTEFFKIIPFHQKMHTNYHINPCTQKVICPIVKQSFGRGQIFRRSLCPQIMKIRGIKSYGDLINGQRMSCCNTNNKKKYINNVEMCRLVSSKITQSFPNKKSTNSTITTYQSTHPKSLNTSTYHKNTQGNHLERILKQNLELNNQLNKQQKKLIQTQKQYCSLEQRYIRLLQISNQRSQSYINMFIEQQESKIYRSKYKAETISQQAQRLKQKLEGLQLSNIKLNQDTSFKLSEKMI